MSGYIAPFLGLGAGLVNPKSKTLFGSDAKVKQLQNYNPGQQQHQGDILGMLKDLMQPGGGFNQAQQYNQNILGNGPEAFQNFSEPYLQQFQEQVLPMIAERFAGQGALSSSGFGQALGGSASSLQSSLAQLFSNLQQQSAGQEYNQFNNLSQLGLQPSFSHYEKPGKQGMFAPLMTALFKGLTGGSF